MRRPFPLVLVTVIFWILLVPSGFATSFYIAANGSDSNNGTSESTPWLHAPGMPGVSGKPASYSPQPGDSIVLRGCDTWIFSGQWNIQSSGSSGNLISYGGLDQTWYNTSVCPSGWNRPILSGGGTWPGSSNGTLFETNGKSYLNIEWMEFTGLYYSGAQATAIDLNTGTNINVFDNYIHGWQIGTINGAAEFFGIYRTVANSGDQIQLYLNVIDGSDADANSQGSSCEICAYLDGPLPGGAVYQNYFANSNGCFIFGPQSFHDNTMVNCGLNPTPGTGQHNNIFESNTDRPNMTFYNNLIINGNTGNSNNTTQNQMAPTAGTTSYAFNNVIVNSNPGADHNMMCEAALTNPGGTCMWFNNTVEGGADSEASGSEGAPPHYSAGVVASGTATLANNHFITSSAAPAYDTAGGSISGSPVGEVIQSQPAANAQSYSLTQAYPFSPVSGCTSGTCSTLQAGTNESSLCATISNFDSAAGAACKNDTTLGIAYASGTHTVSFPARAANARPSSGNWDAGAYQLGSGSTVAPPTGLVATVQ